ncbi:MAG: phenylacetate--CoA ligase family protein [Nitrospinota bacterium]|nr:MAG: phenylacetate--CoA ligase family protein [Nitrospinota bacterium]
MSGEFYDASVEKMGRDELMALQSRRLVSQVHRIYENAPFYREKWDAAGVHPDDIRSIEDITKLPFVRKEELREAQERYGQFGRLATAPRETWAELHPSTGTTGRQVGTLWTKGDVERITDFTARLLWMQGVRSHHVIQNGFSLGLWVAGIAVHYAAQRLGAFTIPIGAISAEKQIEMFQEWRSDVFFATPSFGVYIAKRMADKGLSGKDIPLSLGSFGGEPGAEVEATRRLLEEGLGITALDIYGLAEIGPTMAAECGAKSGLHWTEDHHYVEIVDPTTGEPVPEGKQGVLVITHLTREGTPMIRYWTNDIARLDTATCACGRTHARSPGGILGRVDDLIIVKGTNFYPAQVEEVVRGTPGLADEFRLRIKDTGAGFVDCTLVVEVEAQGEATDILTRLRRAVKERIGVTLPVETVPVGTLERTEFKARRVIREKSSA